MTYKETLDWMFSQLPMYQEKGKNAFTGKLDNILSFTSQLNNPHQKFKSIHVAGTNGKGSCSHMLASILQEAGYKVGLYTSPHLKDFSERIKINGAPIDNTFVVDFISFHKHFFKKHKLSFFEMSVGMAFDYFEKEKVDIAIIEVGLGGRLDSTNIITPEVSLITNIGFDHMDILGNSFEEISKEKAGIIKEGVPIVISEYQEGNAKLFREIAQERNATLTFASESVEKVYETSLLGLYQAKNVMGVVASIKALNGFRISNSNIVEGLKNVAPNTGLMGRWQILQETPKVICDTAHNKEGLSLVLNQLSKEDYQGLHIVLGFVKDKSLNTVLPLFPKEATYYFCKPNIPRGLIADELSIAAKKYGLQGKTFKSVQDAYVAAKEQSKFNDLVYVGGSTFVVAEVV